MFEWFEALPLLEKIFYYIALPATAILLVQTLMLLIGGFGGESDGFDADADASGLDVELDADMDFDTDIDLDIDVEMDDLPDISDIPGSERTEQSAVDTSGIRLVTTRGVLSFFTIAGWTGILFMEMSVPAIFTILLAFIFGAGAMVCVAYLVRALMRLDTSGRKDYNVALGQICDVYLTIPAGASGFGKITMTLGGRFSEYDAITNGSQPLKTGAVVRIVDIISGNVMVVEPEEQELAGRDIPV